MKLAAHEESLILERKHTMTTTAATINDGAETLEQHTMKMAASDKG